MTSSANNDTGGRKVYLAHVTEDKYTFPLVVSASSEWYVIAGVAMDLDRRGALSEGGGRCTVRLMPFAHAALTAGEDIAVAAPGDGPVYELRHGRERALLSESRFGDDPSADRDADTAAAAAETMPRPALMEDDAAVEAEIAKSMDDPILKQVTDMKQRLDLIIQQRVAAAKAQGDENTGSWTMEGDAEAIARMVAARACRDDCGRQASQTPSTSPPALEEDATAVARLRARRTRK